MTSRRYCLASAKGGAGKTVIAASFAAFLAGLGKTVLLVDVDPATNGLTLLYLGEINKHKNLAKGKEACLLSGMFDSPPIVLERDIVHLPNKVDMLPSTFDFSNTNIALSADDFLIRLQCLLSDADGHYDFVFLDAQAGIDSVSRTAMRRDICDEVVLVAEYDPLSAAGLERMKGSMHEDLVYSRTWILLNKLLPDFVQSFSEFLEISKYLNPIPWDADVVRAYARRKIPLDVVDGNEFTLAIMQSLKRLLGDDTEAEINEWANNRAAAIRLPIQLQYRDAEKELKGLFVLKARLEKKAILSSFGHMASSVGPVLVVTFGILAAVSGFLPLTTHSVPSPGKRLFWQFLITACSVVVGLFITSTVLQVRRKNAETSLRESHSKRQIEVLEERLKKLEVLRRADLNTLIKHKRST